MFGSAPGPSLGRLVGVALLALIAQATVVYWLVSWHIGAWWFANAAALWLTLPAALLLTGRRAEPVLVPSARPLRLLAGLLLAAALTVLVTVPNLFLALVLARLSGNLALAVITAFGLCVLPAMWLAAKLLAALPWPAHLMLAAPVLAPSPTARRLSAAVAARPILAALAALMVLALAAVALTGLVRTLNRWDTSAAAMSPAGRVPIAGSPAPTTPPPAPGPQPTPASPHLPDPSPPATDTPSKAPAPPDDALKRFGLASWYYGPSGSCAAKGFEPGTLIRVTHGSRSLTCRVTMIGPHIAGRIVNLPQRSFAKLAHPDRGLVHVTVSAVT